MKKIKGNTLAIIAVYGIFIAAAAIIMLAPSIFAIGCTMKVTGIVIDYDSDTREDRDDHSTYTVYSPIYKFYIDDVEYTARSHNYSGSPAHKIGDKVKIKVDPDDLTRISDPLGIEFYLFGTAIIVFFTVLIIKDIVKDRKKMKEEAEMETVSDSDSLYG